MSYVWLRRNRYVRSLAVVPTLADNPLSYIIIKFWTGIVVVLSADRTGLWVIEARGFRSDTGIDTNVGSIRPGLSPTPFGHPLQPSVAVSAHQWPSVPVSDLQSGPQINHFVFSLNF